MDDWHALCDLQAVVGKVRVSVLRSGMWHFFPNVNPLGLAAQTRIRRRGRHGYKVPLTSTSHFAVLAAITVVVLLFVHLSCAKGTGYAVGQASLALC